MASGARLSIFEMPRSLSVAKKRDERIQHASEKNNMYSKQSESAGADETALRRGPIVGPEVVAGDVDLIKPSSQSCGSEASLKFWKGSFSRMLRERVHGS